MSKSTIKSYKDQFIALIEGDDAKVQSEKQFRQAEAALRSHVASYEGDTIDKEEAIRTAKDNLEKARLNNGVVIENRSRYITTLLKSKQDVVTAEKALKVHQAKIKFLKEELAKLTE